MKQTRLTSGAAVAGTTSGSTPDTNDDEMTLADAARDSLMEGDVVRVHGYRGAVQVESLALSTSLNTISSATGAKTAFGPATGSTDEGDVSGGTAIRDSGFKYRVSFDS